MRRNPLILISPSTQKQGAEFSDTSLSLSQRYPWAILAAGGVPWVLPSLPNGEMVADCVRRCDGVMLSGGDDVQPELYSARLSPRLRRTLGPVDPARDLMEILLINEVFRQRKPLLAICRGQQILNVALGGTLVVDIPSQLPAALRHNRSDRKDQLVHEAELEEGSLMASLMQRPNRPTWYIQFYVSGKPRQVAHEGRTRDMVLPEFGRGPLGSGQFFPRPARGECREKTGLDQPRLPAFLRIAPGDARREPLQDCNAHGQFAANRRATLQLPDA